MKRRMRHDYYPDLNKEVSSDGMTVWVQDARCLARFCRLSQEFIEPDLNLLHRETLNPTREEWGHFCELVKKRYGIPILDRHRPKYIPGDYHGA